MHIGNTYPHNGRQDPTVKENVNKAIAMLRNPTEAWLLGRMMRSDGVTGKKEQHNGARTGSAESAPRGHAGRMRMKSMRESRMLAGGDTKAFGQPAQSSLRHRHMTAQCGAASGTESSLERREKPQDRDDPGWTRRPFSPPAGQIKLLLAS